MSAITILTQAAQADAGAGGAVDVSAFNTLRINWTVLTDIAMAKFLRLFIETSPTATGPWNTIDKRQLDANGWGPSHRVVLSVFDNFVRARWEGEVARALGQSGIVGGNGRDQRVVIQPPTPLFTIGLAGEAS